MRRDSKLVRQTIIPVFAFLISAAVLISFIVLHGRLGVTKSTSQSQSQRESSEVDDIQQASLVFYESIGDKAPSTTNASAISQDRYTIELMEFTSKQKAENFLDVLATKGLQAYFTPIMRNGRVFYLVRRGIFSSAADGETELKSIKNSKMITGRVSKL